MRNIDKQWLSQKISAMESTRDDIPFGLDEDDSNTLAALKIALASIDAEKSQKPIAWVDAEGIELLGLGCVAEVTAEKDEVNCHALYAAPPAPAVMKDHQIRELVNELRDIAVEYHGTQQLRERIAHIVRSAMLQGAGAAEKCRSGENPQVVQHDN